MVLPPAHPNQVCVKLALLDGGSLTLPEDKFVYPAESERRITVPSMLFLVKHPNSATSRSDHLLFDLGLRSNPTNYTAPQQKHVLGREPMIYPSPIKERLSEGGLIPNDIDAIILSHVHWDHTGDPQEFPESTFIAGHGSIGLLTADSSSALSHAHFDETVLPKGRTIELPPATSPAPVSSMATQISTAQFKELKSKRSLPISMQWLVYNDSLPPMLDLFGDGSVFIVDSPGHLQGHINLLCRVGPKKWYYLAGDACHDIRLLTGEKEIATWSDGGRLCCIHVDKEQAKKTLATIKSLQELKDEDVEVILAHDVEWFKANSSKKWPLFFGA